MCTFVRSSNYTFCIMKFLFMFNGLYLIEGIIFTQAQTVITVFLAQTARNFQKKISFISLEKTSYGYRIKFTPLAEWIVDYGIRICNHLATYYILNSLTIKNEKVENSLVNIYLLKTICTQQDSFSLAKWVEFLEQSQEIKPRLTTAFYWFHVKWIH